MSILEGKGCEEIGGEEENRIIKWEVTQGDIAHHHSQILRDEEMVIVLTNHFFGFVGKQIVRMPYLLDRPQQRISIREEESDISKNMNDNEEKM